MQQTMFIATNLVRDEDGQHLMLGTGSNGEQYFVFELSKEVANEIAQKMDLQIVNVQKPKTWQKDEEVTEEKKAVALQ